MGKVNARRHIDRKYTTKAGKEKLYKYGYRINEDGEFIRLSNKGYQANNKLTSLQFKNGKLTKTGEAYLNDIANSDMPEAQKTYLKNEFLNYAARQAQNNEVFTLERWTSHLKENKTERMIYNLGVTPDDIAKQISDLLGDDVTISRADILDSDNWDFKNHTFKFMSNGSWIMLSMDYDYEAYNGFRFSII